MLSQNLIPKLMKSAKYHYIRLLLINYNYNKTTIEKILQLKEEVIEYANRS